MALAAEFCELYERATQLGGERFLLGLAHTLASARTGRARCRWLST